MAPTALATALAAVVLPRRRQHSSHRKVGCVHPLPAPGRRQRCKHTHSKVHVTCGLQKAARPLLLLHCCQGLPPPLMLMLLLAALPQEQGPLRQQIHVVDASNNRFGIDQEAGDAAVQSCQSLETEDSPLSLGAECWVVLDQDKVFQDCTLYYFQCR